MYCFPPDIYGNQVCDSTSKNEDIVNEVPYQTTCDANDDIRNDFLKACECKNGLDSLLIVSNRDDVEVTSEDLKYSKTYLHKKWASEGNWYSITQYNYHEDYANMPFQNTYAKEQCKAKKEYYQNQVWYKKIPIRKK